MTQWKSRIVQKPRRLYHKVNYTKIIKELDQTDSDREFENKTVQEAWETFKALLEAIIDIPMSTPKARTSIIHG